jgi:hypothetical protein
MTPYRKADAHSRADLAEGFPPVIAWLVGLVCSLQVLGGWLRGDDLGGEFTVALILLVLLARAILFPGVAKSPPC